MATTTTEGGKRKRKRRKADPRKSAAQEEKLAQKHDNGIEVTENFVKRGSRIIPIVKPGMVPAIPSLPDSATHFRRVAQARQKATGEIAADPSKLASNPSAPPEVRMKTFAEQSGPSRHDELQQDSVRKMKRVLSEKTADDKDNQVDLGNPLSAMCPDALRESQPADFRPSEQLRQFVESLCNAPSTTQGAALRRRVMYSVVDQPTVHISDAELAGLEPVFLLGRQIEASPNKRYCGYDCPSLDTYIDAEAKVRQLLEAWDAGKEAKYRKTTFDVERKVLEDTDNKGRTIRTKPVIDKFHYRQKLYIFRPMDDAGQICIVVA